MDLNKEYQCLSCSNYGEDDGTLGHNCTLCNMHPKNFGDNKKCKSYEKRTDEFKHYIRKRFFLLIDGFNIEIRKESDGGDINWCCHIRDNIKGYTSWGSGANGIKIIYFKENTIDRLCSSIINRLSIISNNFLDALIVSLKYSNSIGFSTRDIYVSTNSHYPNHKSYTIKVRGINKDKNIDGLYGLIYESQYGMKTRESASSAIVAYLSDAVSRLHKVISYFSGVDIFEHSDIFRESKLRE